MELSIEGNNVVCDIEGNTYKGFTTNLTLYDVNKNKWINVLDMMKDCRKNNGLKISTSEANEAFALAGLMPEDNLLVGESDVFTISGDPTKGNNNDLHGEILDPEHENKRDALIGKITIHKNRIRNSQDTGLNCQISTAQYVFVDSGSISPEKLMLTPKNKYKVIWSFAQQMDPGKLNYNEGYHLFNENYTLNRTFLGRLGRTTHNIDYIKSGGAAVNNVFSGEFGEPKTSSKTNFRIEFAIDGNSVPCQQNNLDLTDNITSLMLSNSLGTSYPGNFDPNVNNKNIWEYCKGNSEKNNSLLACLNITNPETKISINNKLEILKILEMKSLGDSAQLYSAIAFILYLTIKRIKNGVATYVGESVAPAPAPAPVASVPAPEPEAAGENPALIEKLNDPKINEAIESAQILKMVEKPERVADIKVPTDSLSNDTIEFAMAMGLMALKTNEGGYKNKAKLNKPIEKKYYINSDNKSNTFKKNAKKNIKKGGSVYNVKQEGITQSKQDTVLLTADNTLWQMCIIMGVPSLMSGDGGDITLHGSTNIKEYSVSNPNYPAIFTSKSEQYVNIVIDQLIKKKEDFLTAITNPGKYKFYYGKRSLSLQPSSYTRGWNKSLHDYFMEKKLFELYLDIIDYYIAQLNTYKTSFTTIKISSEAQYEAEYSKIQVVINDMKYDKNDAFLTQRKHNLFLFRKTNYFTRADKSELIIVPGDNSLLEHLDYLLDASEKEKCGLIKESVKKVENLIKEYLKKIADDRVLTQKLASAAKAVKSTVAKVKPKRSKRGKSKRTKTKRRKSKKTRKYRKKKRTIKKKKNKKTMKKRIKKGGVLTDNPGLDYLFFDGLDEYSNIEEHFVLDEISVNKKHPDRITYGISYNGPDKLEILMLHVTYMEFLKIGTKRPLILYDFDNIIDDQAYIAQHKHFSILFNMLYEKYSNDINILLEGNYTLKLFDQQEFIFYRDLINKPYPLSYCPNIDSQIFVNIALEKAIINYEKAWSLSKYINFGNNQEYKPSNPETLASLEKFSPEEEETQARGPAPEPEYQEAPRDFDLKRTESLVWSQELV